MVDKLSEYSELAKLFPGIYGEDESKIKDVYGINQHRELFKKFDLLKNVQSDCVSCFSESTSMHKIPKILHFIWLGEKPLPEEFRQNILYFSNRMQELGGISVLWTDQINIESTFRSWLKGAAIHLMDVQTVFGNHKMMATFFHFKAALAKIPSNFGEASDLLRYEIIDQFGGYYLDGDVKKDDIDLNALLLKGDNPPYGFVCGQCSIKNYCRNDLFGSTPKKLLIKYLKNLILNNYKKKRWKNQVTYSRSFLADFTVLTTGPDAFNEAIVRFISQGKKLDDRKKKQIIRSTFLSSVVGYSAESWVYNHTNQKSINFLNDQNRLERIKHDLMLNLLYDEKILDLEKYQQHLKPDEQEWLVCLIEELLKKHSRLFKCVDRIFIGSVDIYCRLQKSLEEVLNRKIVWDELAVLKFACVMKKDNLVTFLIDSKNINPFDFTFANVGYYDCSHAQPFGILLETGNLEMIAKILTSSRLEDVQKSFIPRELGLIYVGSRQWATHASISSIPKLKIKQYEKQQVLLEPIEREEINRHIEHFQSIQQLIDPFLDQSKT